jgi:dihydroneopterin aldolase
MGVIKVNGIKLYAYHGCMAEEAKIGTNYIVDVTVRSDLQKAALTDNLSDTADYVTINRVVADQMAIRSKLIEVVCKRILDQLMEEMPMVTYAEVTIAKMYPPINGNVESVSVSMESHR